MKPLRTFCSIVAAQLLLGAVAVFGQSYKVESIGGPSAPDVTKSVQDLLNPQGIRVVSDQGRPWCEMWVRKTVPASPNPTKSADMLYGALSEGTFLGVVHFPNAAADFRGQALKPGYYTLRYALIPQDGNHMGVNPYRDTVVLGPLAADTQPETALNYEGLVKLSRQASGTPHPAILVMQPVGGTTFPSAVKDDQGYWDVELKLQDQNGELPIALTVVGKWSG